MDDTRSVGGVTKSPESRSPALAAEAGERAWWRELVARRDAVIQAATAWRSSPRNPKRELELRLAIDALNEHRARQATP
jgi:hypothetical protein